MIFIILIIILIISSFYLVYLNNQIHPIYKIDTFSEQENMTPFGNSYGCKWYKVLAAVLCSSNCTDSPNYKSCNCGCYDSFGCNYPGCN